VLRAGVPFVLRAGKALNERSVVVRMQLHAHPVPLFGAAAAHNEMRNEFVMRLQPGEGEEICCYFCHFGRGKGRVGGVWLWFGGCVDAAQKVGTLLVAVGSLLAQQHRSRKRH
jgi:hypothetical protein